jgi:hypothetical protein
MDPLNDSPPPWHQPPEGTYPVWPPASPPSAPGYPPYAAPYAPYPPYAPNARPRRGDNGWFVAGVVLFVAAIVGSSVAATNSLSQIMHKSSRSVTHPTSVQSHTSQHFAVTGVPTVQIDIGDGSVKVVSGAAGTVSMDATITAGGGSVAAAKRNLESTGFSARQSGNTISVHLPDMLSSSPLFPPAADLVITVPAASNVNARVTYGNVTVTGVTGVLTATLREGEFGAQGLVLRDSSRVQVNYGHVFLNGTLAPGANASVTVESGDATVTLPRSIATQLSATTESGNIRSNGWWDNLVWHGNGVNSVTGDSGPSASGALKIYVVTGDIMLNTR